MLRTSSTQLSTPSYYYQGRVTKPLVVIVNLLSTPCHSAIAEKAAVVFCEPMFGRMSEVTVR